MRDRKYLQGERRNFLARELFLACDGIPVRVLGLLMHCHRYDPQSLVAKVLSTENLANGVIGDEMDGETTIEVSSLGRLAIS